MSDFRERIEKLSPKRLTLLALELQSRLEELESHAAEVIAVIGVGCRIPGAEEGAEGFWRLLAKGGNAVSAVPEDRWDNAAYYDPDPDAPGRTATMWGGFLPAIDRFDAAFFGISAREAVGMDPQQRLLLEVCWEALEHAGQSPRQLSGSATGVFVGLSTNDYYNLVLTRGEEAINAYVGTGTAHSVAAGRISYVLGLQGPSIAVDTSCSGSLVSVHLACQSLRTRECRLALAGGANVILTPEVTIALSKAHMMAADGQSKAFDSRADGFVRSEGCGIVVLKRLSDALADGNRILALIRGSAVNQDGRSSGLTAPNGAAQEAVIRQALSNAGVRPEEISYVEAHGTGTSLGDPIEAHALATVLGPGRTRDNPLVIGSVKTNIGHLEAAAGIAGLIKVVLALEHEQIPKHLHFQELNPYINWGVAPVEIPREALPWPRGERRRLAGVSSFGFSGTNAHVIVEESPLRAQPQRELERPQHILAVSARGETALRTLTERYAEELAGEKAELGDICFTANAGRAQLEEREAYVAATREEMREVLRGQPLARGEKDSNFQAVFLFPGQGAQYAGMGRELYQTHPEFRRTLEQCAEMLKGELEEPLLEVLWGARTDLLDQTLYTQPALFAVEYAIAQLWRSWGIEPAAVLGHSVGEYVAACVAGVYSLVDGLRLVTRRAGLMQTVKGRGQMAAVMAPEHQVREALDGLEKRVGIAALNAAESVVISGYAEDVEIVEERLKRAGCRVQRLKVSHGFHSPQMAEIEAAFEEVARGARFDAPRVQLISSLTGKTVSGSELAESSYWRRQIREPVRFQAAMETLGGLGFRVYVEAGPGTILTGLGKQAVQGASNLWVESLKSGRGDWRQMLESLGHLWARGAEVDWAKFDDPYKRQRVSLPTYPFERRRFWVENGSHHPTQQRKIAATAVPDDWFYKLAWDPKPYRSVARQLGRAKDLASTLSEGASALRTQHGLDAYDRLRPEFNTVCADFIVSALRDSGWDFREGVAATQRELIDRCGIADRHQMLFARLLDILAEDGILACDRDTYTVLRSPVQGRPAEAIAALMARHSAFRPELEMTSRCTIPLASVLQGKTDPLQLLFPSGSLETAEAIYSHSPGPQVFNRLAAQVVAEELRARPDGTLAVLEIGAGTGGTTAYIVPLLPADRTEYTFTDVSPFFQARAKEKFKDSPILRYHTLDIEKDPAAQGFQNEQFDIVIAANVLHATADLRETLRHIRCLLAPGGSVVVIEGTYPERWVDLTFGLMEGWWRFRDRDLRGSYPLLGRGAWLDLLAQSGFEDAHAVQPLEGSHQSIFFARVPSAVSARGRWLIMPDTLGISASLAREVEQAGGTAVVASRGHTAASYLEAESWNHVVDLQPIGTSDPELLSPEQLGEEVLLSAAAPIATLQALLRTRGSSKLWVATRGAQAVLPSEKTLAVTGSTAWGVARCIRLEHPHLWGGVLDLDPEASNEGNARRCLDAILCSDGEDQVAFRISQRFVPRLIRSERPASTGLEIRGDGTYLVTGGLGGLGLRVAHWLVQRGARDIVLMGRTGLPDRADWDTLSMESPEARRVGSVKAMEEMGATVTIACADVADEEALASLLERSPARKLRGVIHAAAAFGGGSVKDMTRAELAAVLRAKTMGTWALHRATASMNLDFFLLFSSSTSLLGARDLSHYAAACQFLDAFAHHRRTMGLPAVSINWGTWPHLGTSERDRDRFFRGGLKPMEWENALAALGEVIASDLRQITIGRFDWSILKPLYESQRSVPLLQRISSATPASSQAPEEAGPPSKELLSQVRLSTGPQREQALMRYLVHALASILGAEPDVVDSNRPVTDFGVDSLIALEFKNRIGADLGFLIPTVRILAGPTLRELASLAAIALPAQPALPSIGPYASSHEFPLSFGQQTQWFAHKFMPGSSTFNVAFTAKASPHLVWDDFLRALEKLIARHSALRTIFVEDDEGHPLQRILPAARPDAALIDARSWQEEELRDAVFREFRHSFALDRPPFRVRVFRGLSSDVMLFNVDHIIIDAWSVRLCFAELKSLYTAELVGSDPALPAISADYQQFVEHEAKLAEGPEGERLWSYWSRQLAGDPPPLRLPSSRPRPAVLVAQGECIPLTFGASRSAGVQRMARDNKTTVYSVLLAAFNVLLYHYTGQDDITVGTSVSGRENPQWANAIGYFVNLLPMRARLSGNPAFVDHLLRTRDTVFGALEHQDLPFAVVVTKLRVPRSLGRSPVFQAFFNFLTDRSGELGPLFMGVRDCAVEFGSSILTPSIIIPQQEGQSEIVLQLTEVERELVGNLNYNSEILDRPTAEEMAHAYCSILDAIIRDPSVRVDDLKPVGSASNSELEDLVF